MSLVGKLFSSESTVLQLEGNLTEMHGATSGCEVFGFGGLLSHRSSVTGMGTLDTGDMSSMESTGVVRSSHSASVENFQVSGSSTSSAVFGEASSVGSKHTATSSSLSMSSDQTSVSKRPPGMVSISRSVCSLSPGVLDVSLVGGPVSGSDSRGMLFGVHSYVVSVTTDVLLVLNSGQSEAMGLQCRARGGVHLTLAARSVSDVDVSSVVVLGHPPVAVVAEGVFSIDLSPGCAVMVVENGNPRVLGVVLPIVPSGLVSAGFGRGGDDGSQFAGSEHVESSAP